MNIVYQQIILNAVNDILPLKELLFLLLHRINYFNSVKFWIGKLTSKNKIIIKKQK